MDELRRFTVSEAKPLPVIILADVSGSMDADGKIRALNASLHDMLQEFARADDLRAQIHVAIITFGGEARLHVPLQPANRASWTDMAANGATPMGAAFSMAADLIEDRQAIPGTAFRPTVVLVSDGQPTDDWQAGLTRLTQGRGQKADRLALAIGGDADVEMLRRFLGDENKRVFVAAEARQIREFFRLVTMSVSARSQSANPNQLPALRDPFDLDKI